MSKPIETERKLLIRMPSIDSILAIDGVRVKNIEQTYLQASGSRVRKIIEGNKISYIKTIKERISTLSCFEEEFEISPQRYIDELKNADVDKKPICKTRYCVPFEGHIIEIDIFPFWTDRAILEVELSSEKESFSLPDFIDVIKEVSEDARYKNTSLARAVPFDSIAF